jgi:hypothetical protein
LLTNLFAIHRLGVFVLRFAVISRALNYDMFFKDLSNLRVSTDPVRLADLLGKSLVGLFSAEPRILYRKFAFWLATRNFFHPHLLSPFGCAFEAPS